MCVTAKNLFMGCYKTGVKDRGAFIHDERTPVTHLGGLAHNPHIEVWKVGYLIFCFVSLHRFIFLILSSGKNTIADQR